VGDLRSASTADRQRRLSDRGNPVRECIDVIDDQGTTHLLEIWGDFPRRFTTNVPVSPSTRGLAFDGEQVDLLESADAPGCRVEPLPSVEPAVAHLWLPLATYFCLFPLPGSLPLVDTGIQALSAGRALAPDSPVIEQVRDVVLACTGPEAATSKLPARWASLLSGSLRAGGPIGVLAVGAGIPELGETSIILERFVTRASEFRLYVTVSPAWQLTRAPFQGPGAVAPLSWWAEDDRGNHYRGYASGTCRAAPADRGEASIRFWSGLDRRATAL
jgi:hypothetical protein